jgi:hypothetical protein
MWVWVSVWGLMWVRVRVQVRVLMIYARDIMYCELLI